MKKVCIFGTGQAGMMVAKWLPAEYKLISYIDNQEKKQNQKIEGISVVSLPKALEFLPDVIWIAVLNKEATVSIKGQIRESGFTGEILDIGDFRQYQDIRVASLRLIAQEIKDRNVPGELAELGVFRGDFASVINELFPEKEFHLFDTFEGFDEKDIQIEEQFGTPGMGQRDFSNTSMGLVKSKMMYLEKVHFHKGYFPETFPKDMPRLAFVSLDPDLYEPVYQGLKHFYPLLNSGGVILIHDYNSIQFPGAKKAVTKYAEEQGIYVIPLMDMHGSAIILKP